MPITGPIPLPKSGMDAFLDSLQKTAEARKSMAQANLPFGGANVPGPAGQVVGLQMVKMLYGEGSPEYQQALNAFNLSQGSTAARTTYENALTGSLPLRYTTPQGRSMIEASNVSQGASPAGTPSGQPVVSGQPAYDPNAVTEASGGVTPQQQYALKQTKSNLPNVVLQRNLAATNIEKTLNNINVKDLTYYNGVGGQAELKRQQALDLMGKDTSPEFKKYKEAESTFNFLPDQIRQFYGSSISPGAVKQRTEKLDPRSMFHSAATGQLRFNSSKELLGKELQTYRSAAQTPTVYTGQDKNISSPKESENEGQEPPKDTIWMLRPDGVKVPVHNDNVSIAKEKYKYKEVE